MYPNEVDAQHLGIFLGPSMALLNCVPGSFSCLTQTGEGSSTHSKDELFGKVFLGKVCGPSLLQACCLKLSVGRPWVKRCLQKMDPDVYKSLFQDLIRVIRDGQVYPNEVDALHLGILGLIWLS